MTLAAPSTTIRPQGVTVHEPGSRSRTTDLWMLPEDEQVFGDRVSELPVLEAERTLVWKALRAATRPAKLMGHAGPGPQGLRIGDAARELAATEGLPLGRSGGPRYWLA